MYGAKISNRKAISIKLTLKICLFLSGISSLVNAWNSLCLETSKKHGKTVTSPNKYIIETINGCHASIGKQSIMVWAFFAHEVLSK